jgi:hypothetical protein
MAMAIATAAATGCTTPRTEVVIGVATDLTAPDMIDKVQLSILRDGVQVFVTDPPWTLGKGPADISLPVLFGAFAEQSETPSIEVKIDGTLNDNVVVERTAVFSLVKEQTRFYRMALVSSCKTRNCGDPDSNTCIEGACVPNDVDSSVFPTYTDGMETQVSCSGTPAIMFRDTRTGNPMPMVGSGACPQGQHCQEGTCYKNAP